MEFTTMQAVKLRVKNILAADFRWVVSARYICGATARICTSADSEFHIVVRVFVDIDRKPAAVVTPLSDDQN